MLLSLTLAELRPGDVIHARDGRPYRRPLTVATALAPIEPGNPVEGVRLKNPNPASPVERVLYPDQEHGAEFDVERPA